MLKHNEIISAFFVFMKNGLSKSLHPLTQKLAEYLLILIADRNCCAAYLNRIAGNSANFIEVYNKGAVNTHESGGR